MNSDHRHIVLTMPDKLWSFFINNPSLQKLLIKVSAEVIKKIFKNLTNGFVIFADSIIKNSKRYVIGYIARYSRHPAISKRRILAYDGTHVTFSYSAYGKEFTKKMPKFEFIKAVLLHVSSKHFKMVRRFGLYSRRSKDKIEIAKRLLPQPSQKNIQQFSWRRNLATFTNKDPLSCPKCGNEMELYKVTYPDTFGNLKTIVVLEWLRDAEKQVRSQIHLSPV